MIICPVARICSRKFSNSHDGKTYKVKIDMLLNCVGDEALEVYNNFKLEEATILKQVIDLFDNYSSPKKYIVYNT